jgi:hypothetical protein
METHMTVMEACTMKISKETLDILKNFASINSNILVKPGSKIKTISNYKNVLAETTVTEDFPAEFGIWDLNKFLGVVSLFEEPEFEFQEKYVAISGDNGSKVKYFYSEPKLLTTVNKELKMPPSVVNCQILENDFKEIQKAASVLQLPDIKIYTPQDDVDKIVLTVMDRKDPSSNEYSFEVGKQESTEAEFNFYFKVENLKMLSGDYNVEICENSVAKFVNQNRDLTYWVAMEPDSNYKAL